MKPTHDIVAIIPAYNEEATVADIVFSTLEWAAAIVVDDGSHDQTAQRAREAGAMVVELSENGGYEKAIDAGFHTASKNGYEVAITLDADGQLDPSAITKMCAPILNKQADVVVGVRARSARWAEAIFSAYTRIRFGIPDILCGMKAYDLELYRAHGRFDSVGGVGTELAIVAALSKRRIQSFPIKVAERQAGKPRFGSGLKANLRILQAMFWAVRADLGFGYPIVAQRDA